MPNYRRAWMPGGTFFFTVNLLNRNQNDLLISHIYEFRQAVKTVRKNHPFTIHGWVVLPDHLHCIMTLPSDDEDFALRWRLIKTGFSKSIPSVENISPSREKRGERGIWQRRYWEHRIRDERDFSAHMDYIHFNPVKHGLVYSVIEWPYSTFHRLVERGVYHSSWAGSSGIEELGYSD